MRKKALVFSDHCVETSAQDSMMTVTSTRWGHNSSLSLHYCKSAGSCLAHINTLRTIVYIFLPTLASLLKEVLAVSCSEHPDHTSLTHFCCPLQPPGLPLSIKIELTSLFLSPSFLPPNLTWFDPNDQMTRMKDVSRYLWTSESKLIVLGSRS
ncbi:hypothetical protein PoB_006670100 [Plakobranchus ocellatus]|uniref:Uncharacterized protein n=1 Tax=Plakobranchus ocellatus TaxID=259542 RepID=A0AAV4D7R2_9GAST|nr:hypothetical protein PoB_006670100 [Plakobranchus ocellatus]